MTALLILLVVLFAPSTFVGGRVLGIAIAERRDRARARRDRQ